MKREIARTLSILFIFCSFSVLAEEQPEQRVEGTFGDWVKLCTDRDERTVCQIVQTANHESGRLVFQTAVGYVADNDRPVMYLTAPLGIFLPKGISLIVDEDENGVRATVLRCDENGCLAVLAMSDELLARLKRGNEARLFFGATAQRNVEIPLSLTGFTDGFESLEP